MGSKNWAENAKQLFPRVSHFSDVCGGDDGATIMVVVMFKQN